MKGVVCFHSPTEINGYLSNWAKTPFIIDGIHYSSMEQYMMYQKALTFCDLNTAHEIINTTDVRAVKALGREVKGYNDTIWNGTRQLVVYDGLMAKFKQNLGLARKLLDTDNKLLAECAVNDRIWGIGLSMTDPNRHDIHKWRGQNLLGFTLMKVRDDLKLM